MNPSVADGARDVSGRKNPGSRWNVAVKAAVKKKEVSGAIMRLLKKDVRKFIKKRREKLKAVFIRVKMK